MIKKNTGMHPILIRYLLFIIITKVKYAFLFTPAEMIRHNPMVIPIYVTYVEFIVLQETILFGISFPDLESKYLHLAS